MAPSVQRPDPPYMQVVGHIRDRIRSGDLKEGDTIPSARQITQEWGVSLATATKVLAALRSEGLVKGMQGIGTVVVGTTAAPKDRLAAIRSSGRIYTPGEHARIEAAELMEAPDRVADALGLDVGAPVIRRYRVTYRNEQPVSASTSWFDGALAEVAPKLLQTERLRQGTPGYIEEMTGRTATSGRDQVSARLASTEDAAALGIEAGEAVLHGRNWYYDADGMVIEYGEYVSAGNREWSYDYRIES
jgi:DNA-binding GntR family transcriptional regulator